MDRKYWAEAVNTAAYVLNRTGNSLKVGITPYELYHLNEPSVNYFQEFGSRVAVHVPKQKRTKWDSKSCEGMFLGYGDTVKGYRVFFPLQNKVETVRDVVFLPSKKNNLQKREISGSQWYDDDEIYRDETRQEETEICGREELRSREEIHEETEICGQKEVHNEAEISEQTEIPGLETIEEHESTLTTVDNSEQDSLYEEESGDDDSETFMSPDNTPQRRQMLRESTLQRKPDYKKFFNNFVLFNNDVEPNTYIEAVSSSDGDKWSAAIKAEISALEENKTWIRVERPEHCKEIECKWIFRKKKDAEGKIVTYKARLVARGFQQTDVDISDIYSPVAKLSSVRFFLSLCNEYNMEVFQMDVCSAFLYGEIEEDIYITLPDGFESINRDKYVYKLNKSLYGLKVSPKNWNNKFNEVMLSLGFVRSNYEYCLYSKVTEKGHMYLLIYVNDLLLAGTNSADVFNMKKTLSKIFKMKDLGPISYFLGMSIKQDMSNSKITLNQTTYLKSVLCNFGMENCKPVSTPFDTNFDHSVFKREKSESQEIENKCRRLIGVLMYAMLCTRPDLSICVSILSRYQSCASQELWIALKRVLRYI